MTINDIIRKPKLISIDTRTIKKGDVFLAIKGPKFDGHDFVEAAFKKGSQAAIVSRIPKIPPAYKANLIKVGDTVKTLGDIAKIYRSRFRIPVIAITGTNGKTTAKEMVAHVLAARYNVLKNESSKNNHIGLPLTLFELDEKHDVAVLEMGMNHLGEIDNLSEIAKPHIGVVTNIGPSHLEFLGTLRNIFMAKSELLRRLSEEDLAILNKDDFYLRNIKGIKARKIYFGMNRKCHYEARNVSHKGKGWFFSVAVRNNKLTDLDREEIFELPIMGKHNIYNALVAIAVARQFNIDFHTIRERLKAYRQVCRMRLEFVNIHGIEILDDSYNSNPLSMECAVDTLAEYDTAGKRIVVSGDMLELGKSAKRMHENIGRLIAQGPISVLVTIGELSRHMNRAAKKIGFEEAYHASSHSEAADFLRKFAKPGDVVLLKGSRAMEMEKIIEKFR